MLIVMLIQNVAVSFFIGSFIRMSKLLDEEIEEDEMFWNQDALKEVVYLQNGLPWFNFSFFFSFFLFFFQHFLVTWRFFLIM